MNKAFLRAVVSKNQNQKPSVEPHTNSLHPVIEALESRVLLSGIDANFDKKRAFFYDQDGDAVSVVLKGKGTFDIFLQNNVRNRADIQSIQIHDATPDTDLQIKVRSRNVRGDGGDGKRMIRTAGITEVFQVTSDASMDQIRTISAALRNVNIDGDLGSINSVLSNSQFLEFPDGSIPTQKHDLGNVTVDGNLGEISFEGRDDGSNEIDGLIWVGGSLGTLEAINSDVLGGIQVLGNIDQMTVHDVLSNIDTNNFNNLFANVIAGDITVDNDGGTFFIEAEEVLAEARIEQQSGNLDITLVGDISEPDEYFFSGIGVASGNIDLLANFLDETTILDAGNDLFISTHHVDGLLTAGSDIVVSPLDGGFDGFAGTLTAQRINDSVLTPIFVQSGNFTASLTATDGSTGAITLGGGAGTFSGTLNVSDDVRALVAPTFNGAVVNAGDEISSITATSGGIQNSSFGASRLGNINSTSNSNAVAAIGSSNFDATTFMSNITANGASSGGLGIVSSLFESNSSIAAVNVTGAVNLSTFIAGFEIGDDIGQGSEFNGSISSVNVNGVFTSSNLLSGTIGGITISLPGVGGSVLKSPVPTTPSGSITAHVLGAIQVGGGTQEYNGFSAGFDSYLDYNNNNAVDAGEIRVRQLSSTID